MGVLRCGYMYMYLLSELAAAAVPPRDDPVQAHIAAVHAKSAALRRKLLTAWTFEADATPSPGYYHSFAGAPIQHIIAAMYLNENATAVELAQTALANPNMCAPQSQWHSHSRCAASAWWEAAITTDLLGLTIDARLHTARATSAPPMSGRASHAPLPCSTASRAGRESQRCTRAPRRA